MCIDVYNEVSKLDTITIKHSFNVAKLASIFTKFMGCYEEDIYLAGLLHDIGKLQVPREIISKKDTLTIDEIEIMQAHTVNGVISLKELSLDNNSIIYDAVLSHHEKFNGTGYPNKLIGMDIPYIARVISICDSYDAMISNRGYNTVLTKEDALNEIYRQRCVCYDPLLVNVFIKVIDPD